ncbi:MAG: glycosyltransferase [Sulfitobacter sp.]
MMEPSIANHRPLISFVDPCCAGGYDAPDLRKGGLGGTEATVLRVATALRGQFDINIHQNDRAGTSGSEAGTLMPLKVAFRKSQAAAIIVINRWKVALKLRKLNSDTPIFVWLHVYPGRHNRKMGAALKDANITVICVSESHAKAFEEFLGSEDIPDVTTIYNPIADDLHPDDTRRDPNRLLFASSPHKGLAEVFNQFSLLRATLPDLTLAVADPGYLNWDTGPVPNGVVFLGSLSHSALIRQMRRSLCLFYPQTSFAETFGLVLAEANAVGTPALVHSDLGANDEILTGADQKIDGHSPAQILARIRLWQRSPPRLGANPAFRMSKVAATWTNLITRAVDPRAQTQKSVA